MQLIQLITHSKVKLSSPVIAIARQIFQNKVFSLPGEVFLIKKKKKVFMKNLPGASNI
jgi:hypothetical protein